ncbi:MAB_1171c family putative transporter [Nocardia sp. NPDC055321]
MEFALVYGSVGTLAAVVFTWRLVLAVRGPRGSARWAVAIAIACTAVGFVTAMPAAYEWVARVSGVPNLATLIVYSAITTAVMAQIVWTTYLVVPDGNTSPIRNVNARNVVVANAVVVAIMIGLFAAAPVHDAPHATDFDHHYATEPVVDAFLAIYLTAYTLALLRIVVLCRAWLPHVREQPWLRRGLRLLTVGSIIAVGYSVGKVVAVAAAWAGIDARTLNSDIAPAFASAGATVMLVGYLCPSLLPRATAAVQRIRALPRLRPLWTALRTAAPEVARAAPETRRAPRDLVYRRVIEIRDALLLLQPHLTARDTALAERVADRLGVRERDRAAAVEAARIAVALRAYEAGAVAVDGGESFRRPDRPTFLGELGWLVAVSTAYRSSPVVPAVLLETSESVPPPS